MTAVEKRRLGEGVWGRASFDYRYADSANRFETPFGSRRPIKYGDKLLAKLILKGKTVIEFFISEVSDFSELMMELRKKVKGLRGLAKLYVRNYSRGWSIERPLMLYSSCEKKVPVGSSLNSSDRERMLFPWETH